MCHERVGGMSVDPVRSRLLAELWDRDRRYYTLARESVDRVRELVPTPFQLGERLHGLARGRGSAPLALECLGGLREEW